MVWSTLRLFRRSQCGKHPTLVVGRIMLRIPLLVLLAFASTVSAQTALPDAPAPNPELVAAASTEISVPPLKPTHISLVEEDSFSSPPGQQTFPPVFSPRRGLNMPGLQSGYLPEPRPCVADFCTQLPPRRSCCALSTDPFNEYLRQNAIHIYTPHELAGMAVRGVIDPFNLLTIVGTSAFSVATDAHTRFGPGALGIAKYSGVALTQDMTSAFFETFLIPSIDHQDPRFRRMPNASLRRRVAHCLYQPIWTDSDTGQGMFNYATVVGDVADELVGVTYVPYQRVGVGPAASRIAVNLATTPLGNIVTEFLPDLARHINFSVVFVQRVINRVAADETGGGGTF
ncbi:MAG TPA: hypothetical protein VIY53_12800 [Acidobacteriaceae bacterium]